jgi:geranylgeranyl pyrophosphate synthase
MTDDLAAWLDAGRAAFDAHLDGAFTDAWPAAFAEPARYPLFGGGKRVRPALVFAAYEAIQGPGCDLAPALPAAAAVELVHTYSLVHDDLPAMDNDSTRRGRPTLHVVYGDGLAILAGDGLLAEAFTTLAVAALPAEVRIALVADLADAAGYRGMIGGQAADVGLGGPIATAHALTRLHALKTGALLRASATLGGRCAGASPAQLDALARVGAEVGLAFQLADDLLDADQDAGEGGPPSFVKLLGADETRRLAEQTAARAIDAARALPHPERLVQLARYFVERTV